MLTSLLTPLNVSANNTSSKVAKKDNVTNNIHNTLAKEFEEEEYVRYLVMLHEQTDTMEIALNAEKNANKNSLSKFEIKEAKQKAVVASLLETAKGSQKTLASYLEDEKASGTVKEFRSYYIVNGFAVTGNKKTAEEIAKFPEVKSVMLDETQELVPIVEDEELTLLNEQSKSENIEWNIDRINAPELWEKGITGEGTVIANIDTGVAVNHPALKTQYRGYNPEDPKNPSHEYNWYDAINGAGSPMDSDGHGTHTMGTMIGQEMNGKNPIGVAPGAKWISARAFFLGETRDSYLLDAAQWVLAPTDKNGVPNPEMAPDVVNNSWGGNPLNNDWYRPIVQAWRAVGIVPIFSVGNASSLNNADPGSASAPANYPESIAVGATDEKDDLAAFSLRGPTERGDVKPDITAPGVNIRSAFPGERWDKFEYESLNGTSMAAPHVAATVLLMRQVDKSLTVDQIEDILKFTATTKTDKEYPTTPNNGYGYGSLNAKAAIEAVEQGIGLINGQVIGEGIDNESPTFEHDERKVFYKEEDLNISVNAMDDKSVNEVTLSILFDDKTEKTYEAKRVEGDQQNGIFQATILAKDITDKIVGYKWIIKDFSGKITKSNDYPVTIKEGLTVGYMEDFESYPDGWYSYGRHNSWEWGSPEFGPETAVSGEKVMGTHLRGQYEMGADMTLVMPPVLAEKGMLLRFNQWYSLTRFGGDTGIVYASTDGKTWDQLYENTKENKNWHEVGIDLSAYAGKKIHIAYNLESGDNRSDGWYIDDVRLVNTGTQSANANISTEEASLKTETADFSYPQSGLKKQKTVDIDTLPVEATVEVEETGWITKTNPQNGEFSFNHTPGEYKLKVDAYGFESTTKFVTVTEKEVALPTIKLKALPQQIVSGKIEDNFGNGIKDAKVFLVEDEKSIPVKSKEDGTFSINTFEGNYTLKVFANGYYGETETITVEDNKKVNVEVQLRSFFDNENVEIKYDNGRYSKNIAMGRKGNGFAVKMTLDEGKQSAMLTTAKLQFWAGHVPVPGGDDILISVYDAKGKDGQPGNKLAGPIEAKAKRDLFNWTEVDLSELGIFVDSDFYVVYLQADDYPYVPGFVSDGDKKNAAGRSWDFIGGQWFEANESFGNYMIRAVVDYGEDLPDMERPVITSPMANEVTKNKSITIEGTASPSANIQLKNHKEEVKVVEVNKDGSFSIPTELIEGENKFTVATLYNGVPVNSSNSISVVLDTIKPEITISNPKNDDNITEKTVTVEGTVIDANLDSVEVNGETALLDKENYSKEITLDIGENEIEVIAIDLAGNRQVKSILVTVIEEQINPVIEKLQPAIDQYLVPGDEIEIAFTSDSVGGTADFLIKLPAQNSTLSSTSNMVEVKPGVYKGTWTVPVKTNLKGAVIQVALTDATGIKVEKEAEGKLYISQDQLDRVSGKDRYLTAIETSKTGWVKSDTVVIARGDNFADALAGVPLAHKLNAPVLLTLSNKLYDKTINEINRLGAKKVIILGGSSAISDSVTKELEKAGLKVERISGVNRFDTAAKIALEVAPKGVAKVVIANGMDFPDALSVAAHAAKEGLPILLTEKNKLSLETKVAIESLKATQTILVGGTTVVSANVEKQLPNTTRLAGKDRYETNVKVAEHFGVQSKHAYVATGKSYADALTGAVLAAKNDGTVLLVHDKVPEEITTYITNHDIRHLTIFGGESAVSSKVASELERIMK